MRKIVYTGIIFFCAASLMAQGIGVNFTRQEYKTVSLYQEADSVLLFAVPAGAELRSLTIICDSAYTGGETDSIKVGIQGEDTPYTDSFRFADIASDSLSAGDALALSHTHYRQGNAGKLYIYDGEVAVECTDADTYYPVTNMLRFPYGTFDTSITGSALIAGKYMDAWYEGSFNISFSASKAATAQVELFKNGAAYGEIAIERTISTGNQFGAASASGGVHLAAGDSLGVSMKTSSAGTTFTIHHMQVSAAEFDDSAPYRTGSTSKNIMLYCGATTGRFRFVLEYIVIP